MPYYRYHFIVKNLVNILKEKQEAEQGQMDKYNKGDMNPKGIMKDAQKNMPKMNMPKIPSGGNMNFPSMPNF